VEAASCGGWVSLPEQAENAKTAITPNT
jgi:hypothetical protein